VLGVKFGPLARVGPARTLGIRSDSARLGSARPDSISRLAAPAVASSSTRSRREDRFHVVNLAPSRACSCSRDNGRGGPERASAPQSPVCVNCKKHSGSRHQSRRPLGKARPFALRADGAFVNFVKSTPAKSRKYNTFSFGQDERLYFLRRRLANTRARAHTIRCRPSVWRRASLVGNLAKFNRPPRPGIK
jgi:hypothetical protein